MGLRSIMALTVCLTFMAATFSTKTELLAFRFSKVCISFSTAGVILLTDFGESKEESEIIAFLNDLVFTSLEKN